MLLHRPLLDDITIAAAAVALIALIVAVAVGLTVRRLRGSFRVLDGPDGPQTTLEAIARVEAACAQLGVEVADARNAITATRLDLADALRHVAVVRYDAFGDMGGRMSFTAALLDDAGDGLVISSINARTEGRSYAKGVKAGKSESSLSPEEQQAISLALGGASKAQAVSESR